jgi:1-deoxy-D-xylulose-5-phosphate reductoisomerase
MRLDFEPPDPVRFPCLRLARQALETAGIYPAAFNAANEVAVDAFLGQQVGFLDIPTIIDRTLQKMPTREPEHLEDVLEADRLARELATQWTQRPT